MRSLHTQTREKPQFSATREKPQFSATREKLQFSATREKPQYSQEQINKCFKNIFLKRKKSYILGQDIFFLGSRVFII